MSRGGIVSRDILVQKRRKNALNSKFQNMSIFRVTGNAFHNASRLQRPLVPISPISQAAKFHACHAGIEDLDVQCLKKNSRPCLKLRRSAIIRKPATALRRDFTTATDSYSDADQLISASQDPGPSNSNVSSQPFIGISVKSPVESTALPITARATIPLHMRTQLNTPVRFYSMEREFKEMITLGKKPCFAPKKLKPKPPPIDWTSPCACSAKKVIDNCLKATCKEKVIPCPKPIMWVPWQCPKRPKAIRMKKRREKSRILLGYKVCAQPARMKPFECFPKPPPPPPPPAPTPKRCPCFAAVELITETPCRKVPCAKEPVDCRTVRRPPVCVVCPPIKMTKPKKGPPCKIPVCD